MPFLEEPPVQRKRPPSASQPGRRGGRSKNEQLLSLSDNVSLTPPIQAQPVEPCGTQKQLEKNQETPEQELTVQPQEETDGPTRRGKKRGAEAEEETSDDATVGKRVCFEQMPQPTSENHHGQSRTAPISVVSLGFTGSWEWDEEEDIDVIGGSSPAPDPVIICWTESSEGEKEEEDEDVDVVGEKTDYTSSVVIATVS